MDACMQPHRETQTCLLSFVSTSAQRTTLVCCLNRNQLSLTQILQQVVCAKLTSPTHFSHCFAFELLTWKSTLPLMSHTYSLTCHTLAMQKHAASLCNKNSTQVRLSVQPAHYKQGHTSAFLKSKIYGFKFQECSHIHRQLTMIIVTLLK